MTKEQVTKHGEVIKWFCDNPDKGVWIKDMNDWHIVNEPAFLTCDLIVPNDEYAKFHKKVYDLESELKD